MKKCSKLLFFRKKCITMRLEQTGSAAIWNFRAQNVLW